MSRNPLYLGGMIIFIGLAALLNSFWLLILLVPAVIAVIIVLIAPEEEYLAEQFGGSYSRYVMRVHRWFGRRR